jgi:hypothetical protein
MRQPKIFLDHGFHLARRNGVKIKDVSDLNLYRLGKRIVEINVAHGLNRMLISAALCVSL